MFFEFFNTNETSDKTKDTAVILPIEGRLYPVDIHYMRDPAQNYISATVDTVIKIHKAEPAGDILAFLTGAVSITIPSSQLWLSGNTYTFNMYAQFVLPVIHICYISYLFRMR